MHEYQDKEDNKGLAQAAPVNALVAWRACDLSLCCLRWSRRPLAGLQLPLAVGGAAQCTARAARLSRHAMLHLQVHY